MNHYFRFKQFEVRQERCAMKVSTDSCLFGAWTNKTAQCVGRILDIGAGTGLLSLMLAQGCDADIDAVEIEAECYGQLKENIDASPWGARIQAIHADIRTLELPQQYALIVSNPPFYEQQLASPDKAANAARHSSELTLASLFARAKELMRDDGMFAVLLPFYRKEEMMAEAGRHGMFAKHVADARHSPAHPWFRTMAIFSSVQVVTSQEKIDVRNEQGEYSDAFRELLKPYYLFL